jgi:hypothetical protein
MNAPRRANRARPSARRVSTSATLAAGARWRKSGLAKCSVSRAMPFSQAALFLLQPRFFLLKIDQSLERDEHFEIRRGGGRRLGRGLKSAGLHRFPFAQFSEVGDVVGERFQNGFGGRGRRGQIDRHPDGLAGGHVHFRSDGPQGGHHVLHEPDGSLVLIAGGQVLPEGLVRLFHQQSLRGTAEGCPEGLPQLFRDEGHERVQGVENPVQDFRQGLTGRPGRVGVGAGDRRGLTISMYQSQKSFQKNP